MGFTTYNCLSLTGGTLRSVDTLSVQILIDGDRAVVMDSSDNLLFFEFDFDSTLAENIDVHPYRVRPDDYATQGVWLEQTYGGAGGGIYKTKYISAGTKTPTDTVGAEVGTYEYTTTYDPTYDYLAFSGSQDEFASINFPMPEDWDRGTIKVKFYWAPGSSLCTAGDTVMWKLRAVAVGNDDAIDTAFGTPQEILDTVLAGKDADMHISDATPAITVGGTIVLGDMIQFRVQRDISEDNMTEDAWLFGIFIQYKVGEDVVVW